MNDIADRIRSTIDAMGFVLVRVKITGGRRKTLQVMVERPDGSMNVEDCTEVSRALSAYMDVEDPVSGEYVLEVSSPGIDRPLIKREDYERFVGHLAKIKLREPLKGRKKFVGTLIGVEGESVILTLKSESKASDQSAQHLPLAQIDDAKLILTDALIALSLKNGQAEENETKVPV